MLHDDSSHSTGIWGAIGALVGLLIAFAIIAVRAKDRPRESVAPRSAFRWLRRNYRAEAAEIQLGEMPGWARSQLSTAGFTAEDVRDWCHPDRWGEPDRSRVDAWMWQGTLMKLRRDDTPGLRGQALKLQEGTWSRSGWSCGLVEPPDGRPIYQRYRCSYPPYHSGRHSWQHGGSH